MTNKKIPRKYTIALVLTILILLGGILLSVNMTGNVINNPEISQDNSNDKSTDKNNNTLPPIDSSNNKGGGHSSVSSGDDLQLIDSEDFNEEYSYSDDYSEGGFFIDKSNEEIQVSRSYVWKSQFGSIFVGKIKILSSSEKSSWEGSRIAMVNPDNTLERYEIRLLPNEQRVEVRYVDRTNRSGTTSGYDPSTISEYLDSSQCNIEEGKWYYVSVFRNGNKFKAQIVRFDKPTCFIDWEDDRIEGEELGIGIQSAGKYVVSRFDRVFTN